MPQSPPRQVLPFRELLILLFPNSLRRTYHMLSPEILPHNKRPHPHQTYNPHSEIPQHPSPVSLNGRGAYICPNAECMKRARKSKGLERAFKMPIPDEIYDSLTKEIEVFE